MAAAELIVEKAEVNVLETFPMVELMFEFIDAMEDWILFVALEKTEAASSVPLLTPVVSEVIFTWSSLSLAIESYLLNSLTLKVISSDQLSPVFGIAQFPGAMLGIVRCIFKIPYVEAKLLLFKNQLAFNTEKSRQAALLNQ
jgi:hypothetical protein